MIRDYCPVSLFLSWSGFPFFVNSASPQPMMSPSRVGRGSLPLFFHSLLTRCHATSLGPALRMVSMWLVSSCPSRIWRIRLCSKSSVGAQCLPVLWAFCVHFRGKSLVFLVKTLYFGAIQTRPLGALAKMSYVHAWTIPMVRSVPFLCGSGLFPRRFLYKSQRT